MIQHLEVKGLNDQFDYEFEFNEDLNIFTGANGCGKTTLLKLIWYFISGNLHRIVDEIPFKKVSIETTQFSVQINPSKHRKESHLNLVWKFGTGREKHHKAYRKRIAQNQTILHLNGAIVSGSQNSLFFPTFRRIEGGFSIDRNAVHTEDAAVVRLLSSTTEMLQTAMSRLSGELSTDRHKFITSVSTKDIEELLPLKKIEIADKVNELYAELSLRIGKEVSSSDVLQPNSDRAISALEHIQGDLLEAGKTREKLEKRLTVLDDTVKIIFGREIQVGKGLTLGEKSERQGPPIHADKLSSGEKQMLGFLCYNAFSDNTSIFIDEPELSLHQDWQDILLPLLLKQETGNQFFVATHSEFIYDQFPDKEHILNLEGN